MVSWQRRAVTASLCLGVAAAAATVSGQQSVFTDEVTVTANFAAATYIGM